MISTIALHHTGFIVVALVGCVLSLILSGIYYFHYRKMRRDLDQLFRGKDAKNLEEIILSHGAQLSSIDRDVEELFEISNMIHQLASKSIHKVALEKFNPFGELGGNQSFCVALLDGQNTGTVISSLHAREGTRIYAKSVAKGKPSGAEFTEEEKRVITQASLQKPKKIA